MLTTRTSRRRYRRRRHRRNEVTTVPNRSISAHCLNRRKAEICHVQRVSIVARLFWATHRFVTIVNTAAGLHP